MAAREVQITKASSLQSNTGQTEGMIRKGAIIDKCDNICASGISYIAMKALSIYLC